MIYLDNAATTRPHPDVIDAVVRALRDDFGNPSSRHRPGLSARRAVEESREEIARYCGIEPQGVVFTSGGTEANQLAALGLPLRSGTTRILSTNAEHPSLARPLAARRGVELLLAPIGRDGALDLERASELLDERVGLVAMFEGHNETGARNAIAPLVELVRARAPRALIHLDCVQAIGRSQPPPFQLGVDSAAVTAHKIHGPKGVGALLLRKRTAIEPQQLGGGQEHGLRSGTENVAGIVGFATAIRLIAELTADQHQRMRARQRRLADGLRAAIPGLRVLAAPERSLPHIVTCTIPGASAEVLLHHLEEHEICASAGAACHASSHELSPALRAVGLTDEEIRGTLRLSLARDSSDAEIDRVLEVLPGIVASVRALGAAR